MILRSLVSLSLSIILMPQVQGLESELVFSSNISSGQRSTLKRDLQQLENMSFSAAADSKTLSLMQLNDLNSYSALQWLHERVSVVLEDGPSNRLNITAVPFRDYPVTAVPAVEKALPPPSSGSGRGVTVMSNIGTALYHSGKSTDKLLNLTVKTGVFSRHKVTIDSPRAGIIQIGEGLFMRRYLLNKTNDAALSNSLGRMAVFFHEARHSDGRGQSLGFFHAVCPTDHDFAGSHACDRNLNGPYSIGAQMMKEFIKNCHECNAAEKEQMRLRYLDSMNRVLVDTPQIIAGVDEEVDRLNDVLNVNKRLYEMGHALGQPSATIYQKILELEKQLDEAAVASDAVELIPSTNWDANPERARVNSRR